MGESALRDINFDTHQGIVNFPTHLCEDFDGKRLLRGQFLVTTQQTQPIKTEEFTNPSAFIENAFHTYQGVQSRMLGLSMVDAAYKPNFSVAVTVHGKTSAMNFGHRHIQPYDALMIGPGIRPAAMMFDDVGYVPIGLYVMDPLIWSNDRNDLLQNYADDPEQFYTIMRETVPFTALPFLVASQASSENDINKIYKRIDDDKNEQTYKTEMKSFLDAEKAEVLALHKSLNGDASAFLKKVKRMYQNMLLYHAAGRAVGNSAPGTLVSLNIE